MVEVGEGSPPFAEHFENLGGALVTPGLVNTHHHLYQTLTRTRAQQAGLFTWLKELYPLLASTQSPSTRRRAPGSRSSCFRAARPSSTITTSSRPAALAVEEIQAARELGVRIVASRGSMDVGESQGGLPPDDLVEDMDAVLADTEGLHALHEEGPARDADRGRALLALLRLEAADDGVRGARAAPGPAAAHASGRDRRGGGVLPRPSVAVRSSTSSSSAGWQETSGARIASIFGRGHAGLRLGRHRSCALPDFEPAARGGALRRCGR